jgi:type II secretory pathway component PulF
MEFIKQHLPSSVRLAQMMFVIYVDNIRVVVVVAIVVVVVAVRRFLQWREFQQFRHRILLDLPLPFASSNRLIRTRRRHGR